MTYWRNSAVHTHELSLLLVKQMSSVVDAFSMQPLAQPERPGMSLDPTSHAVEVGVGAVVVPVGV
jgi:hypothetical protein